MDNHGIPPPATGADDVPVDRVPNAASGGQYKDEAEMDAETGFALNSNPKETPVSPFGNLGSKGGRGL